MAPSTYIQLDHNLVPGKLEDIGRNINLPGRQEEQQAGEGGRRLRQESTYLLNKYEIKEVDIKDLLVMKGVNKEDAKDANDTEVEGEEKADEEAVIGSSGKVYFDHDFGLFSAILACYNNHWVLRTSPDDWWNVIVRNVAQTVDDNGGKERVRDFFVAHQGQKHIEIKVPGSLGHIDYSWLFDQFSAGIKANIKTPAFADIVQADFSTSTAVQKISCQVMLMASLQKYFTYGFSTRCGIPGVEMVGTEEDWRMLVEKTRKLERLLQPLMEDLVVGEEWHKKNLSGWFTSTLATLEQLVATCRGEPDREWWGHVLSWNETYGSGARSWWSGWMVDFLMAGRAEGPQDFQSGLVTVPVKITDDPVSDTGRVVAGTVGFLVEEGVERPVVVPQQVWGLVMKKGSPITPLLGHHRQT